MQRSSLTMLDRHCGEFLTSLQQQQRVHPCQDFLSGMISECRPNHLHPKYKFRYKKHHNIQYFIIYFLSLLYYYFKYVILGKAFGK